MSEPVRQTDSRLVVAESSASGWRLEQIGQVFIASRGHVRLAFQTYEEILGHVGRNQDENCLEPRFVLAVSESARSAHLFDRREKHAICTATNLAPSSAISLSDFRGMDFCEACKNRLDSDLKFDPDAPREYNRFTNYLREEAKSRSIKIKEAFISDDGPGVWIETEQDSTMRKLERLHLDGIQADVSTRWGAIMSPDLTFRDVVLDIEFINPLKASLTLIFDLFTDRSFLQKIVDFHSITLMQTGPFSIAIRDTEVDPLPTLIHVVPQLMRRGGIEYMDSDSAR